MASRGVRRSRHEEEEESYFVSMADMMVGLLFVFIILLLYFALQFRQTTHDIASADESRATILKKLDHALKAQGLQVSIDVDQGVLRLPEDVLFDVGQPGLTPRGQQAVAILGQAMIKELPCYAWPRPLGECPPTSQHLDAIFIEGHTDSDPMAGRQGAIRDNLDLSVMRATNTYRALLAATPALGLLRNRSPAQGIPQPILSVSGYGADRPVDPSDTTDAKRRNRRIDLRFLMAAPKDPRAAMTALRKAAEAIARTGIHPALTAERLFAIERVAAGLDALRVAPFEPWDDLVARAATELAVLSDGELRRLIDGIWHLPGPGRIAAPIVGEIVARERRSADRALIEAYLRHYPKDHPSFRVLREAAAAAAERHDWPWHARGRRWRLWESDGPDALRRAIADGGDGAALLADAGLAGALLQGAFALAVCAL